MKNLLFCLLVLIFGVNYSYAQIPVCAGSCGPGSCGPGSCSLRGCGPSCGPGGCNVFSRVTSNNNSISYDIVNIVEVDRMYVKVRAWDRIYTIPVINGYLPEITQKTGPNDLILDYKSKILYDREVYAGRGYVVYTLSDDDSSVLSKKRVLNQPKIGAVKGPDYVPKATQSNVPRRPNNDEIDTLLNGASKTFRSQTNDRAPKRPSDEEIDNLLNF